jgi:hypothetical protein
MAYPKQPDTSLGERVGERTSRAVIALQDKGWWAQLKAPFTLARANATDDFNTVRGSSTLAIASGAITGLIWGISISIITLSALALMGSPLIAYGAIVAGVITTCSIANCVRRSYRYAQSENYKLHGAERSAEIVKNAGLSAPLPVPELEAPAPMLSAPAPLILPEPEPQISQVEKLLARSPHLAPAKHAESVQAAPTMQLAKA